MIDWEQKQITKEEIQVLTRNLKNKERSIKCRIAISSCEGETMIIRVKKEKAKDCN